MKYQIAHRNLKAELNICRKSRSDLSASGRRCSCNYSWSCQQKMAAESEAMCLKGKTTGRSRNFILEERDFMWFFSQVWAYVFYVMDGSDLGRWGHFPV